MTNLTNYVVCYFNYYSGELEIHFIKSTSKRQSILETIEKPYPDMENNLPEEYEDIISYYANCDASIAVKEIPEKIE